VYITGFALSNSSTPGSGIIMLDASNCTVVDVSVSDNLIGVKLLYSDHNTIAFSNVYNNTYGITLEHSNSNLMAFNDLSSYWHGIRLDYSSNNTILRNTVRNCSQGIYLRLSQNNAIINNTIENGTRAITLGGSVSVSLSGNALSNSGVYLYGHLLQHWNTHTIDVSNTVNGRPIQYWKNEVGGSIPSGAGQVILANCSDVTVADQNVTNTSAGIQLGFSPYNVITGNTASYNSLGGIRLHLSDNNTVSRNNASHNLGEEVLIDVLITGMYIYDSNGNTVRNNTVSNNVRGIHLDSSVGNSILGNAVYSNTQAGIALYDSNHNSVMGNAVLANWMGIVASGSMNTISENTVSWNDVAGIEFHAASMSNASQNAITFSPVGIFVLSSVEISLEENTMVEDGIWMSGGLLKHWNTHGIGVSNTVNGKPVHYWKDVIGGEVPSGAGEVILANCSNVMVRNQNLSNGTVGMELGFSSDNTISEITSNHNNFHGIFLHSSDGNTIMDSHMSHNDHGLYVQTSDVNIVDNNTVSHNDYGISLGGSQGSIVVNNRASENRRGIWLYASAGNTVAENTVHANDQVGIEVNGSDDNDIRDNDVFQNNRHGIHVNQSEGNSISRNLVVNNSLGIYVNRNSRHNVVFDNVVVNNSAQGISLISSYLNEAHHNNITDNGVQARDDRWDNQWDDYYPSGGNFWSDYTGVDNCSGPSQDICPDPDGIGDTPYGIDADSQDRYPLMAPYEPPTRPPTVHDAILSGGAFENVTLKWLLSPDDGVGLRSVVEYEIFRGEIYHLDGLGYQLIASLTNQTTSYTDESAAEGDPNNYFYIICAIDRNNFTACAEDQAGKFTRPLSHGPNLVSVPLIQSNESIETVLQTVRYDKAWYYDSLSGEWKWYMTSKTYRRGLWNMDHTDGIWVNVTQNCNLTVAGMVPAQTTIHLYEGWNLVSFPSLNTSYSVSDLKTEIGATRVEGYDLAPPHHLSVLGDGEVLQAGKAYWVRVLADTEWIVELP
jgi:parallel beta-helix repeat protein